MKFQQRNARYERLQTNADEHEMQRNSFAKEAQEDIELHANDLENSISQTDNYYAANSYAANGNRSATMQSDNNVAFPASRHCMQMAISTLAIILLYLSLSICLTFYQNHLIKEMKFPLSIVTYHMVIKLMLAACVRAAYRWHLGKSRVLLDWRTTLRKMAPTGIASGIDIGFSMWGMQLVNISLYTMTKSTTIIFIMIFAILLGLEKKSWSLLAIVGLIFSGLFMFTYKSTDFNMLGFVFLLVASLSSGVRWSLAQFLIQKAQLGLHNPIDMIFHMQPWMIATLLPMSIVFEGQRFVNILSYIPQIDSNAILMVFLKISFAAVLAFFMEFCEFLVLSKTSSLTLSIAGIFKDICQLALAVEINNDRLSLMNAIGMIVCLAGICCHLLHKYMLVMRMEAFQALNTGDAIFNETSININDVAAGNSTVAGSSGLNAGQKHSAQTVPLLHELSDSFDSDELEDEPNASDVIFDVLKRRDIQR